MIPFAAKENIRKLLRVSSILKSNAFRYHGLPTGEIVTPEPEIWKFYLNNGFVFVLYFYMICRIPSALADQSDWRLQQLFALTFATLLLTLVCICSAEFILRGDYLINFINRLYYTAEQFGSKHLNQYI
jgi:hypothetical protein